MLKRERVHIEVNDDTIASGGAWDVIEPVYWSVSIYDGPDLYDYQLSKFSDAQRYLQAIHRYLTEVQNGGHEQFYSNSTGLVWQDARDGFREIGLPRGAAILDVTARRMGGEPSRDRQEREDQLEQESPEFDDCDEALYDLVDKVDLEELFMKYIRSRPADFYFSGEIERAVMPDLNA